MTIQGGDFRRLPTLNDKNPFFWGGDVRIHDHKTGDIPSPNDNFENSYPLNCCTHDQYFQDFLPASELK